MRRTDPLIVGAGPAGSAAAIALAAGGARPLLIERHAAPGATVCGAFVGWDALAGLARLGVDAWALGAQPIDHVRIVAGGRVIERRLPHRAAGLSRVRLDAALRERAVLAGAELRYGLAARRLDDAGVHLSDGATIAADSLFLATGKYALRGCTRTGSHGATRLGLRTALPGRPELAGVIELHLFDQGYAGLLLQEDGRTNLCISIAPDRLERRPDALLARLAQQSPAFAARLGSGWGPIAAVAAVPYGWRADATAHGRFRLGDQAAVIASVVGDGIAIALASGRAAAAAWLDGGPGAAPAFQRGFAARARGPVARAELARAAAERPHWSGPAMTLLRAPGALALAARLTRIGH